MAHENATDGIDRRGFEWYYWSNLLRQEANPLLLQVRRESVGILRPVFSSDRKLLASVDEQGKVFLWDADDGSLLRKINAHDGPIDAIRFNADATRLVTIGAEDNTVKVWDCSNGNSESALQKDESLLNAWFDDQGRCLAATGKEQGVDVWNVAEGQVAFGLQNMDSFASRLVFGVTGCYWWIRSRVCSCSMHRPENKSKR